LIYDKASSGGPHDPDIHPELHDPDSYPYIGDIYAKQYREEHGLGPDDPVEYPDEPATPAGICA